jgi:hypothetical protein
MSAESLREFMMRISASRNGKCFILHPRAVSEKVHFDQEADFSVRLVLQMKYFLIESGH